MNRIDQTFQDLKKLKKKALIPFITAGDPNLKTTEELVLAFEKAGASIIELGVPYSDPLADGPTIQAASERALKHNVDISKILNLVKRIRTKSQIPICLMTYYNPVFHYGELKFIKEAAKSGVDGVIIPDLPPEEGQALIKQARTSNLATIFFLSPTTTIARAKFILKYSTGFTYYVSLTGVTGSRQSMANTFHKHIKQIKKFSNKPICVGFGVSTKEQVKSVNRTADGAIVGSAIINQILKNKGKSTLVRNVAKFVSSLT